MATIKQTVLFTAVSVLSGCTLVDGESYSQETLNAISHSEDTLLTRLDEIDSNLDKQSDYIASLEAEIINLSNEVEVLQQASRAKAQANSKAKSARSNSQTILIEPISPTRTEIVTLGAIERVRIDVIKSDFTARVDTGAATSSLNAVDMQEFERNGKKWIKFHLSNNEHNDADRKWIEAPIIRHVKIRQSDKDETERRAVIELWIELGQIHEKAQFTLADRSQMDHPILLGREFIQDIAVVDVGREYIQTTKLNKNTAKPNK